MISPRIAGPDLAVKDGKSSFENGRAFGGKWGKRKGVTAGEVLGELLASLGEQIDDKGFTEFEVLEEPSLAIDGEKDEGRSQGEGAERRGGHPPYLGSPAGRDDSDPARPASQSLTERFGGHRERPQARTSSFFQPRNSRMRCL
jgi:hypothetical protein